MDAAAGLVFGFGSWVKSWDMQRHKDQVPVAGTRGLSTEALLQDLTRTPD